MEQWKTYKLSELCTKVTDGSHFSPSAQANGYPMFSVKDMLEYGFDYNKCKRISKEDFLIMKNNGCVPEKGDILVAKDGSYLKQIFVCRETREEAILSSIAIFRPDRTKILPDYLCYLIKSPKVYDYISKNCVSGSALPRIVLKAFKDVTLEVPPLSVQNKVIATLKSIDDKIILNSRINHNLEEQAQALYKSWFVDFEPFKDGKFVDSELGMIPEGWRVGKVRDLIDIQSGFAFKSDTFVPSGRYRLITIKAVQDGYLTTYGADYIDNPLPAKMPEYCKLALGDILLSLTGNVGRICIVDDVNLLLNQRVAKLQPINVADRAFVYTLFRNMPFREQVVQLARGTAQLNLSPVETGELSLCIPSRNVLQQFADITMPLFEEILSNSLANKRLELIRDSVLPKFMYAKLTC